MPSLIFPLGQLPAAGAADVLPLQLPLKEGGQRSGGRAPASKPLAQSLSRCLPRQNLPHIRCPCAHTAVWDSVLARLEALVYRGSKTQDSQPQAVCLRFALCSAQAPTFSSACMAGVAFIWFILGSHKLFQGLVMHGNAAGSGAEKKVCKPGLLTMP